MAGVLLFSPQTGHALPPAGTDVLQATGQVSVSSRLGSETIALSGMVTIQRSDPRLEGGVEVIDTEIVAMSLTGASLTGPVSVSESAAFASTGQIRSLQPPPVQFPASSFFDVFVDVVVPISGSSSPPRLHNEVSLRLQADVGAWPPLGVKYAAYPIAPAGSHCDPARVPPGPGGLPLVGPPPGLTPLPAEVCVTGVTITLSEAPTPTPCPTDGCPTGTPSLTPTRTRTPTVTPTPCPTGGCPTPSGAVKALPGCTINALPGNDDGSTGLVPLPFSLSFSGVGYNALYVNNNGHVTFDAPFAGYTPFDLSTASMAIIAPFFADVDTRGAGSGVVTYGNTTFEGRGAFCANWLRVGYFSAHTDKLNSFQLLLVDRTDIGPGDFDIVFNYDQIQWETGDASGGIDGLGDTSARAGYSNGFGAHVQLPGSGVPGSFLDSASSGLVHNSKNSSQSGRYIFTVRNGVRDFDRDGVTDAVDNCPFTRNPQQENHDSDLFGDACDIDDDNDGFQDSSEYSYGSDPFNAASVPEAIAPNAGSCADGIDNDLDGAIDEADSSCRLDFSMGIDIDGDHVDDCSTKVGSATKCTLPLGATFRLRVYLNDRGHVPAYEGFDIYVEPLGVTGKVEGGAAVADANPWPQCVFEAIARPSPNRVAWGCTVGVPPAGPSTYLGLIGTADFNCTTSGSLTMVHADGKYGGPNQWTDLVETVGRILAEGANTRETLAINCGEATPTRTPVPPTVTPLITESTGRMTGGGSVFADDGTRVTHGFRLECDATQGPNNLEVNWRGNRFHLEQLTFASCFDDRSIEPNPPSANFDTYQGTGTGRLNGVEFASATWLFTDAGEPGGADRFTILIDDAEGYPVLSVSGPLTRGNHQAHAGPSAPATPVLRSGTDSDGDGCPDKAELGNDPAQGGRRDRLNHWDYFNPTGDRLNRVDDILAVVRHYRIDEGMPGYDMAHDRTYLGPNPWNLGPPDGHQRVDDILAAMKQYAHDCP